MEDTGVYMTAPTTNRDKPPARRGGPKGLLPSTWINRALRVECVSAWGEGRETAAVLLDYYPAGLILNISAAKTLISWERVCMVELVED